MSRGRTEQWRSRLGEDLDSLLAGCAEFPQYRLRQANNVPPSAAPLHIPAAPMVADSGGVKQAEFKSPPSPQPAVVPIKRRAGRRWSRRHLRSCNARLRRC